MTGPPVPLRSEPARESGGWWLAVLVFGAMGAWTFRDVVLGRALFWGSDLSAYYVHVQRLVAGILHGGDLDALLWVSGFKCGFPLLAEGQGGLYYPPTWLTLLLFSPEAALSAMTIASVLGAAATTWILARSLGASPLGGILAGVVFAWGGYASAHHMHTPLLATLPWLPLLLYLAGRAGGERSLRGWAVVGVVWAFQLFPGHPQVPVMSLVLALLYGAYVSLTRYGTAVAAMGRTAAGALVAASVGVGLAAIHLLPLVELSRASDRPGGHLAYDGAALFSLPPSHVLTALVPYAFGGPTRTPEAGPFAELAFYAGVAPLLLGVAAASLRPRRAGATFFAVAAFVSLLLAFGRYAPFFGIIHALPVFSGFRVPPRFLVIFDLGIALLAGLALDALAGPAPEAGRRRRRLAIAAVLLALVLGVSGARAGWEGAGKAVGLLTASAAWLSAGAILKPHAWKALGVALAVLDLQGFAVDAYRSSFATSAHIGLRHPVFESLHRPPGAGRVFVAFGREPWLFLDNPALEYGFEELAGYSAVNVLAYGRYVHTFWETGRWAFLDGANVRWVADLRPAERRDWPDGRLRLVSDGPHGAVYENPTALPRAYAVHEVCRVSGTSQALGAIAEGLVDLTRAVVLEDPAAPTPSGGGPSEVVVAQYGPTEVRLRATMRGGGYVVLADTHFPGWRVLVDGRPAPIWRANAAFRAVYVEEGAHEVTFVYEPATLRRGAAVSLATVLTLATVGAVGWVRGRRRRAVPPT